MLCKVSFNSHNSNLQSIDFLQTESKERKVCILRSFFIKQYKRELLQNHRTEKVYIIGEVEIIK